MTAILLHGFQVCKGKMAYLRRFKRTEANLTWREDYTEAGGRDLSLCVNKRLLQRKESGHVHGEANSWN